MTREDFGKALGKLRDATDPLWNEAAHVYIQPGLITISIFKIDNLLKIANGQRVIVEDTGFESLRIRVTYTIPGICAECFCSVEDAKAHGLISG